MLISMIDQKQNGPVYFIQPGNIYTITGEMSVNNNNGFLIPISYEMMAYEKIYEIVENELCSLDFNDKLLRVSNKGSNTIYVRVNDSLCPDCLYEIR